MTELDPKALAGALTGLFEWATVHAPRPASLLAVRLGEHLGADPAGLPVVVSPLAGYERVNFQVALDTYLSQDRCEAELIGLSAMHGYRMGLAELARSLDGGPMPAPTLGAAEYESVQVGDREILCVAAGVWLITDHGERLLLMLRRNEQGPHMAELGLEVMAATRQAAERLLGDLRGLMEEHNVYRGRVLVLSGSPWGGLGVDVRGLPAVGREDIVLPAGVLERVERHTSTFSEHAEQLRAAGRHLRRGLLLHGPPGTGKTLTAMYLSALMPGRTVLLLTGQALTAIGPACEMANRLAPAMLVLEDVDLVALERTHFASTNALLFELLNQMDGLRDDSDVVFLLTTNRADVLEPALASRPGRVDLAVRLPLPDADGRSRLIDLYARGLELELDDRDLLVANTEGVSPAFIRELLRRAALMAAERGHPTRVTDHDVNAALGELRQAGDELTATLLGVHDTPADA